MTCPKCGSEKGWKGPIYRSSTLWANPGDLRSLLQPTPGLIKLEDALLLCAKLNERLDYICERCGFEREEPTLDTV